MFEFTGDRSGFATERKPSRVFDESDSGAEDTRGTSRRKQQHTGGMLGDADAGAEDVEDHGEAADFGDDEEERDEVQNIGVGLGLEGSAL